MQEERVKFETAKLAKKKGFEQKGSKCWVKLLSGKVIHNDEIENKLEHERAKYYLSQPTQSLLQKWLREVHNTHLMVEPYYNGEKLLVYGFDLITERAEEETIIEKGFKTYEEALEIGLQEALKLIPNKK